MYSEYDSVAVIPGVGPKVQEALERLDIRRLGDLLRWYPRQYLDASQPLPVRRVPYNDISTVKVTIDSFEEKRSQRKGVSMVDVKAHDTSGELLGRWFQQPYLRQKLRPGTTWIWIGTVTRFQGQTVMISPLLEEEPRILAIYGQTKGVSSKMLRRYVAWTLDNLTFTTVSLPEEIRRVQRFWPETELFQKLHQPTQLTEAEQAQRQIGFTEMFQFFAQMKTSNEHRDTEPGIPIPVDIPYLKELVLRLPFLLTPGQKRAVWQSLKAMETGVPMVRLLNGDVGSGKTVVAALLAALVARAGYQTVIIAPTEILASQHYQTFSTLLSSTGLHIRRWTGAQKDDLDGAHIVVGTHAVLQPSFSLPALAFLVVDEQHRFGVHQRHLLRKQAVPPHLLSMTATPIPRTLALVLYGDLQVSFLKEKPSNRPPVQTRLVKADQRAEMYRVMAQEIAAGHQVFVICALITEKKEKTEPGEEKQLTLLDPTDASEKKTVVAEVERLRQEYPELGVIEAVHGKLKAAEKQRIMERMARGDIDVLVATSVIETGIDIPNATVMVVEGAEYFGLAQLHQFRGRVGRGTAASYCFLCPTKLTSHSAARLHSLVESNDGFVLAEKDLELRGPGELAGNIQSGLPDFRMASLADTDTLLEVKRMVEEYGQKNPQKLQTYSEQVYASAIGNLE